MKHLLLVVAMSPALMGASCSTLPSLDACKEVHYNRIGVDVTISAACTAGVAL